MNRNDIHEYMTQKVRSANASIHFHSKRLQWLKEEGHILWITEQDLLEKHHKDGYAKAIVELERAEHWLTNNVHVPVDLIEKQVERLADQFYLVKLPIPFEESGFEIVPAGKEVTKRMLARAVQAWHNGTLWIDPSPIRNKVWDILTSTTPTTSRA